MTRVKDLTKVENPEASHAVLIGTDEDEDDVWTPLNAISGRLTDSLESSVSIGGLSKGDTFSEGDSVEKIVRNIVRKRNIYNYRSPSLSLSGSGSKMLEVGSKISPLLTASWMPNDGGPLKSLSIDGQNVEPSPYELSVSEFTIGETNISYQAEADHEEGPVVDDNFGDPSPGNISSGTVQSNRVTYRGRRRLFLGTFESEFTLPNASDPNYIRQEATDAIPEKSHGESFGLLNPKEETQYTFNIPKDTLSIVFAYPDGLKSADEVLYIEASRSNQIGSFSQTTYPVSGANSFSPLTYKVYIWNGAEPFPKPVTYKLKI